MSNLEKLLQNLKDGDASLKRLSIQAMVKLPFDQKIISAIRAAADKDPSEDIRFYAKKALAFIEKKTGKSLRDPSADTKENSLNKTAVSDPQKLLNRVKSIAASRDASKIDELKSIIKDDEHPVITAGAAKVLALLDGEKSLSLMAQLLDHNDPRVRANAVEGLNIIKSQKTLPLLMSCLKDSDNRVKANALTGVQRFNSVNITKAFEAMINSPKVSHRESAIWASFYLKEKSVVDILFRTFENEENISIKISILKALGQRPPEEVLHGFDNISKHETLPEIKEYLKEILIKMADKGDAVTKQIGNNILKTLSSDKVLAGSLVKKDSSLSNKTGSVVVKSDLVKEEKVSLQNQKNMQADIGKIVNQKLSEIDQNPSSLGNLRSKESETPQERKAKAMAAMLLVPMGKPQSSIKAEKTNEWKSIESILGERVDIETLSDEQKSELSDFLSTIEVWRNNGFNVEPLFRALNKGQADLEMIFDKYASLIQRCNKLATRFKRLDVSVFKDETVDISLNLKNPTMVEELEIKVTEFEDRTRDMKAEYQEKLEKFKSSGFDVKKLELAMIENLKTIRDEFRDFERKAGSLLDLQDELKPLRCKVFSESIARIDKLFSDAGNAALIKEEISKLKILFDKKMQEYALKVQECENNKDFDTLMLKKAYDNKDIDLIELQLKNYSDLIKIAAGVEDKLLNLDQEVFHDELSILRQKLKNSAAAKEVNFELDELLEKQNKELEKLREHAEKWSKDGYDVSALYAACNNSLTWARKVFHEFSEKQGVALESDVLSNHAAKSSVSFPDTSLSDNNTQDISINQDAAEIQSLKENDNNLPLPDSIGDQLGEDGFPPIEWWNLDFSILREYADEGDENPVLQPEIDSGKETDQNEEIDSYDIDLKNVIEASKEISESFENLPDEEKNKILSSSEESFDELKKEGYSSEAEAEKSIFGEPSGDNDKAFEINHIDIDNSAGRKDKDSAHGSEQKTEKSDISESQLSEPELSENKKEKKVKKPLFKGFTKKQKLIAGAACAVLFVIFIFLGYRYYRENFSASYHTDMGIEMIKNKGYKNAIKSFDRAVAIDPDYTRAGLARLKLFITIGTEQGEVLSNREKYLLKAEEVIKKLKSLKDQELLKQLHSFENDLKHNLAKLYLEITEKRKLSFEEKVNLLTKAYKLNPNGKQAVDIQCNIADLHFKEKNYKKTIEILSKLDKKGVKLKKISFFLAKSYYELFMLEEDRNKKITYLEKAVERQDESKYKTNLQNLYQDKASDIEDIAEKISILVKAYELDKTNVPLRDKVIEMLHESVRISIDIDDKLAAYERLKVYEPDNEKNYKEVIRLNYKKALQTKDPEKRLEILKFVQEKSFEKDPLLIDHIKKTYLEIGDNQTENNSREKWYRLAYDIDPADKEVCARLSKVYLIRGNEETKFSLKELNYKNALKYYPGSEDVTLIYASMHYNRGVTSTDTKEKIFYYNQALGIDKQFVEVYNNLAVEYSKPGPEYNDREMYSNLKNAYTLDPEDPTVKHNLALMFYNYAVKNNDKEQKIKLYKKALEIDPDLEAARENHKLLITKVFRVKDKFGNIIMKSASEMEIKEKPEINDYRVFGPVNMDYLVSQITGFKTEKAPENKDSESGTASDKTSGSIKSEINADL
jgi:HEAT repeat protein/Tfp pilus assembly protein PilF